MRKIRVLCVDDDRPIATIIATVLKREGYETEVAYDGFEALRLVAEFKPDLIVLDILMPDLDGHEVCRILRDNPETAKIAILIVTGMGNVERLRAQPRLVAERVNEQVTTMDDGALEVMTKPFRAKDLIQRVKAILWVAGLSDKREKVVKIGIAHMHEPTREVLVRALTSRLNAAVTGFAYVEDVLNSSMQYDVFVVYNNFGHKMDGVTGVARIRARKPQAFIIGVSPTPYLDRKFLPAGANAFLLRAGNEIEELVRMIKNRPDAKVAAA
ncbi:MAG: response regulator [Chloroflexi bacterium]|nr:response regulator [Chloroflexota bacterium]